MKSAEILEAAHKCVCGEQECDIMLILAGPLGIGKSTFLADLAGHVACAGEIAEGPAN